MRPYPHCLKDEEEATTFDGFKTFLACVARLQTREKQAKLRLNYGGYFAAAAKSALDLAGRREQLSREEMSHAYRVIGQLMETSSQLLYFVDADGTTRNNLVKLLNNWVTSPKMLAEGFVISRSVQGSEII